MSSTLIKANNVSVGRGEKKRVIDSNQAVIERLSLLNRVLENSVSYDDFADGFSEGIDAESVDALLADPVEEEIVPEVTREDIEQMLAEANSQADAIIANANEQARSIIEAANSEAEGIKASAYEEGMASGEARGYEEGLAKTNQIEAELNEKIRQVDEEFEAKIMELEPRFVELLTDIYSHVFSVDMSDRSELVLNMLNNAIHNIDGSKNFFLHVSKEDYEYVNSQKEVLLRGLASTCTVEVIEDMTLSQGNCFIEAESGIYDCGLDTQLENISKELKLLSYTPE